MGSAALRNTKGALKSNDNLVSELLELGVKTSADVLADSFIFLVVLPDDVVLVLIETLDMGVIDGKNLHKEMPQPHHQCGPNQPASSCCWSSSTPIAGKSVEDDRRGVAATLAITGLGDSHPRRLDRLRARLAADGCPESGAAASRGGGTSIDYENNSSET
uniref:Uncharacterized protein n=1 Tax=Panagrellus redivivus TaxID=6233 RepID=A0A7E4URF2_PANRE